MGDATARDQPSLAGMAQSAVHAAIEGAVGTAKETTYLAVGLGLLGVNRLQSRRRELQGRLAAIGLDQHLPGFKASGGHGAPRVDEAVRQAVKFANARGLRVDELVETGRQALRVDELVEEVVRVVDAQGLRLDELVDEAVELVESSLEPFQDRLPPAARGLAEQAMTGARELGTHLRALRGSGSAA